MKRAKHLEVSCGKVWTCDALKFAETYYEYRDN